MRPEKVKRKGKTYVISIANIPVTATFIFASIDGLSVSTGASIRESVPVL